jgi:ankyrin repeat protein
MVFKKSIFCLATFFICNTIWAQDVFDAARTGDIDQLRVLKRIKSDTLESINENGFCPLLLATYRNQNKTVKFLIKQHVNVNQSSQEGTSLLAAAYKNNITITKLLLKHGAIVDAQGKDGITALMFATQSGNKKMILLLLDSKANLSLKDNSGKTALDYAKLSKDKEINVIFDSNK